MRAGLLDQRVTVQTRTESRSGSGEVTWNWVDWRTVWASVLPLSGTKYFSAEQLQAATTHTVKVRYQPGYRTDQRVKHEVEPGVFQYFAIEAVVPIGSDKRHLDLMCTLREATGWR